MTRGCYLTTSELARLDQACRFMRFTDWHGPYLVGSSLERADYKDVDVRSIVPDEVFDAVFAGWDFWGAFCLTVSAYLSEVSGLRVDYQAQRMTEANEKFEGSRNPLGVRKARDFAGGGDFR